MNANTKNESALEVVMQVAAKSLKFTDIPRTTRLFNDYLYQPERTSNFYQQDETNPATLIELAREIVKQSYERDTIADALERQNLRFGSPKLTFDHINLLRQPETVAVVTGQQAGLFAGPLFTIYKALTAIKMAEQLRAQGRAAVPIFWIASEDHDYQEVNHCRIVTKEGQLVTIHYDACWPAGARSVGNIELCPEIEETINQLLSTLPESEFIGQIEQDLRASYRVGVGFAEAFARLLARLFADYGVILLDPQDEELKRLAARIYEPALRNSEEIAQSLVTQSHALEAAGYHAQIHTSLDLVPLFVSDNDQRSAMIRTGDCFTLKTTAQCRTLAELLTEMATEPAHFSPSVALRPIVQDFLLPTVAYVGGPAEVAYFAQLQPVYQFFQRICPLIKPRASFTIVQDRFSNVLNKFNLRFEDLFAGQESVMRKIIESSEDNGPLAVFTETEEIFQAQLDKLRDSLGKVDATMAEALKGSREKIFYQLQHLRTRFINNSAKREETTARQIDRLLAILYPNKNLQERELSAYYFLARYGYGFIKTIYQAIETKANNHQLLYI